MAASLSNGTKPVENNIEVKPGTSKKIESNSTTNDLNSPSIYNENFEFTHTSCYICNGYYGPCFEEPVCATCHTFLFPEELSCAEPVPVFTEKTDDDDSGNDEPIDLCYAPGPAERPVPHQGEGDAVPPAAPPRQDLLALRLELLSTPHEPDDLTPGLVECLPPEVLLVVFSYLDDMSLWSVGNVCKRWRRLLHSRVTPDVWRVYTQRRWPLFKPFCTVDDWFKVYSKLMESCPCKACLLQMSLGSQPPGEENSWRRNRLRNELKSLKTDPPEGIEAVPLDQKSCHWQATITGPVGSPYEGGTFFLYVQVPYSYPMYPPVVRFLTRIFHPNVSRHGDVGIDSIHHNWSLALTISKVLISVQSLLTDPYCQVCMEPSIGRLYMNNRTVFEDIARAWTWRYAMHDALPPL
ncbi:modifier of rpr and grim, ubiquitously expressed [Lycorma delicatula]|uniref:modifier of rpr and grim, ubiquitously expressed n=1 Tax=Lycorma delicatula TaxID=130591 RepID=UPI003F514640